MAITYQLQINAPIEKVFDLVDDDDKIKLWMEGLEETIYTSPQDRENPVGTTFKQKIREGGRVTEYDGVVTAYEKPKHLGVQISNSSFAMQVDYRFTSTPTGTRLDYVAEMVDPSWFTRLMSKLFSWLTNRILHKHMKNLKALGERQA